MVSRSSRFLVPLAVLCAAGAVTLTAPAQAEPHPCRGNPGLRCIQVNVPLDRSGKEPGAIHLAVVRVPAEGPPRGAVLALAGGPGQAASPLISTFVEEMGAALADHDLIVFDQRGTGSSGLLRCPSLEGASVGALGGAVQSCADRLGPRASFYTTLDSVEDIEVVRRAIGVERLALYGSSYGVKVALAYAERYPARVERLLLDSPVPLDGPDPYMRETTRALPRVLRSFCRADACEGITPDPVADLATLVARMRSAPLRGQIVGGDGHPRARHLGRLRLLQILLDGDFDPSFRAEFPAAARSALASDGEPLLRLAHRAALFESTPFTPREFSAATFLATACADGPLPWRPDAPFSERWGEAIARAQAIPESEFFPFDRATARASVLLRLCAHWPQAGKATIAGGTLPDAPALILSGEADLRTPAEEGARIAAQLPRATHLTVPRIGHSVLSSDYSGCAPYAVRLFFSGRPIQTSCPPRTRLRQDFSSFLDELLATAASVPAPVAPVSLASVPEAGRLSGRAARTVTAARLTLADATMQQIYALGDGRRRIGGLRAGRILPDGRLQRYSYVPGVGLSGRTGGIRQRVRVTGRAAIHGVLEFDQERRRVTGRLDGRRIRARLVPAPLEVEVEKLFSRVKRLARGRKRSPRAPAGTRIRNQPSSIFVPAG